MNEILVRNTEIAIARDYRSKGWNEEKLRNYLMKDLHLKEHDLDIAYKTILEIVENDK